MTSAVSLHDVEDVEGFVRKTLALAPLPFKQQEFEELVAEGLCIMYELAAAFEPRREGYAQDGWFSGYAARYLPRRLGDAWHSMHPEHRYVTREDGKREWVYLRPATSLDSLCDRDSRRDQTPGDSVEARLLPPSKWAPVAVAV